MLPSRLCAIPVDSRPPGVGALHHYFGKLPSDFKTENQWCGPRWTCRKHQPCSSCLYLSPPLWSVRSHLRCSSQPVPRRTLLGVKITPFSLRESQSLRRSKDCGFGPSRVLPLLPPTLENDFIPLGFRGFLLVFCFLTASLLTPSAQAGAGGKGDGVQLAYSRC